MNKTNEKVNCAEKAKTKLRVMILFSMGPLKEFILMYRSPFSKAFFAPARR